MHRLFVEYSLDLAVFYRRALSVQLEVGGKKIRLAYVTYNFGQDDISSEVTRTDTLSASERAYQAFPRTRRITVRASGE